MEFIDKTKLKKEGEAVVISFLQRLKTDDRPYPKDLYNTFRSDKNEKSQQSYELLRTILMKEQNNRCCYCMRNLDSSEEKTLEHLIPNKIQDKKAFEEYLSPETVLSNENVCFADDFIKEEKDKFPPFPHTIAYQNLTVSCNGKISRSASATHCNNYRGDKYVEPFILYNTITNEVEYKSDGFAIWKGNKGDIPTLNKLGLNCELLRMIRRIWLYARKTGFNLLTPNETEKKIFFISLQKILSDDEIGTIKNETYWNLLKKYDYFGCNDKKKDIKGIANQLANFSEREINELIEIIKSRY
ncbi:MAG: hypothetical protein LBT25_01450 [Candidatus Symbiothrix sp.]|jgi:hypothetical protein|nr:hypothetical protein [Candidatus Symbiothrix sp.]